VTTSRQSFELRARKRYVEPAHQELASAHCDPFGQVAIMQLSATYRLSSIGVTPDNAAESEPRLMRRTTLRPWAAGLFLGLTVSAAIILWPVASPLLSLSLVAGSAWAQSTTPRANVGAPAKVAPAAPAKSAAAEKSAGSASAGQSIVVLVNDEPITAYEIDQRARFMSLSTSIGERAKESFRRLAQSESTNQRVRAIFEEVIKSNPGKTREQIIALFEERKKLFAQNLEQQAIASARESVVPQFKKEAQEELIEERLKLQEAKKLSLEISEADVNHILKEIAEKNKMTEAQFAQHLKSLGADLETMRARFRANLAWREVVRHKFSAQISIGQKEVDRMVATATESGGEDAVELQVQRITLALPKKLDQTALLQRYAEADGLRRKIGTCKSMAAAVKDLPDAKFEDLKTIRPSTVAEPTRSLLLNAKDGDVLPPSTGSSGVEIYGVCGRRALKPESQKREKAQNELQAREFEIMAKRHLKDLRQDAHVEYR
jgi:peptidyl-prolyl cis-trans isomerase SurA